MTKNTIEHAPRLGRIVIPPLVPDGFSLFYTTADVSGRLGADGVGNIIMTLRARFGIDASLTTCKQVHGKTLRRARSASKWRECDSCDALWSADPHTALGIKVADCLPVTIIDPVHRVTANIHSGWRGAAQRITAAALDTLEAKTKFDANEAMAWLGPSIRVCCFEVGEEVVDEFLAVYADDMTPFVDRERGPKPHIDLVGLTTALLRQRGLTEGNIIDTGLCTRCEGSIFHSYRRDRAAGGRNLAIAAQ